MSEKHKTTLFEELEELGEAMGDFLYALGKSLGIIGIIKKCRFLELKDWIKEREKEALEEAKEK